jgi:5-formyltetrahydrofolate cyclo-ligase
MIKNDSKAVWRQHMRQQRRLAAAQHASPLSINHLNDLPAWGAARVVASYQAINDELDLSRVDREARAANKAVAYPAIVGPGLIEFRLWHEGEPLVEGDMGVREPGPKAQVVPLHAIDFFLVPLLACDQQGYRLGYGGGYYDRALASAAGFRCGVGFSHQLVEQLPTEPHDQALHAFLSEQGVTTF